MNSHCEFMKVIHKRTKMKEMDGMKQRSEVWSILMSNYYISCSFK